MAWNSGGCVVVPIDFSDASAPAVRQAVEMAESPGNVRVLHVLPDLDSVSPGVVFGNIDDESRVATARKYTADFLESHEINGVNVDVLVGDPGIKTVDYASDNDAQLIVVPSHGYHGVKHLLLGSVAERIIRYANCAVMVLRRPDAE